MPHFLCGRQSGNPLCLGLYIHQHVVHVDVNNLFSYIQTLFLEIKNTILQTKLSFHLFYRCQPFDHKGLFFGTLHYSTAGQYQNLNVKNPTAGIDRNRLRETNWPWLLLCWRDQNREKESSLPNNLQKAIKKPLKVRGLFCYRGGYILSAAPLRLDNQFIFHSVSATNCLQIYNIFRSPQSLHQKNSFNSFHNNTPPPSTSTTTSRRDTGQQVELL